MDIILGTGIGDIKFGMDRSDVNKLLGEPTEKELFSYSEEDEDLTEVWHYDEHDFSLSFDEIDDWKLIMIAGSNEEHSINGTTFVGLTYDQVMEDLKKLGFENISEDSLEEGDKVIKVEDKSLNIWFDNGQATEIQWGPFWSDEDTPIFP